jgi:hypothetical protein
VNGKRKFLKNRKTRLDIQIHERCADLPVGQNQGALTGEDDVEFFMSK